MRPIYIIFLFLFTSCATLINKRTYNLDISTCEANTKVVYKDSTWSLPHVLNVRRSRNPLILTAVNDSISRKYTIYPTINVEYIAGNLIWMSFPPCVPMGYLLDLTNPKRFHYGTALIIDATDTASLTLNRTKKGRMKYAFSKGESLKGNTYLNISVPFVNNFYLDVPTQDIKRSTGLLGFSLGVEHFYNKRRALGFNIGMIAQVPNRTISGPGFVSEEMHSFFLTGYKKHQIRKFSFSYGGSYVANRWSQEHDEPFMDTSYKSGTIRMDQSFGVEIAGYYYLNSVVHAGVVFRPTMVTVNRGMIYQQVVTADIAFRFKKRKNSIFIFLSTFHMLLYSSPGSVKMFLFPFISNKKRNMYAFCVLFINFVNVTG